jgi:hypothetical protein
MTLEEKWDINTKSIKIRKTKIGKKCPISKKKKLLNINFTKQSLG